MPSPLFSSPETCQDLQLTFPALFKVVREKGMDESLLSRTASKLSTGDLTLWDRRSGRWAKPAKSDLSKSNPCLKHCQVDIKRKMVSTRWTQGTTFDGTVTVKRRGLRFLGGVTFVPSRETADPLGGTVFPTTPCKSVAELQKRVQTQIPSLKSPNLRERWD